MKKLLNLFVISTLLSSCGAFWHHRELHDIAGMRWSKADVQVFEVEFSEETPLDALLMIRHVHGYSHDNIKCAVEIIKDGESFGKEPVVIQVKDADGEYVGEGSVDLWDVEQRFLTDFLFEPGAYEFRVEHTMPQETVGLIMEVGIKLTQPEG